MRNVLSNNSEAIHYFANNIQDSGRNATSSIFFKGDKIYSYGYHYVLGIRLPGNAILINNTGYSISTSKHISELQSASSHLEQFNLTTCTIESVEKRILHAACKIPRATKNKALYVNQIISDYQQLIRFDNFIKKHKLIPSKLKWDNVFTYSDYKNIKAIDKRSKIYKAITKIYNQVRLDLPKYELELKNAAKIQAAKQKIKNKVAIDKFRFEGTPTNINRIYLSYDILRISNDLQSIESNQGVKLGIDICKHFLNLLFSGENLNGQKLGVYTITSYENNILTIGCHKWQKTELENILTLINNLKK